jgi:hypothetical protein
MHLPSVCKSCANSVTNGFKLLKVTKKPGIIGFQLDSQISRKPNIKYQLHKLLYWLGHAFTVISHFLEFY